MIEANKLKKFLVNEYEQLYTIDLICGGVTSPQLLSKYIDEINVDKKLKEIYMRDKSRGYKEPNGGLLFSMKLIFEDKEKINYKLDDYFLNTRFSFYRDSCFSCVYKGANRLSDLTIGDDLVSGDDGLGRTLVIVHSQKGKALLNSCDSAEYNVTDLDCQRKKNRMIDEPLSKPSQFYYLRELFSDSTMEKLYYENIAINDFLDREWLIRDSWIEKKRDDLTIRMNIFKFMALNIDDVPDIKDNILIYGAGKLGQMLFDCSGDSSVCGFIDRAGVKSMCCGVPVFMPDEEKLKKVVGDGSDYSLIVTPVWDYLMIKENMISKFPKLDVVSLSDIVNEVY